MMSYKRGERVLESTHKHHLRARLPQHSVPRLLKAREQHAEKGQHSVFSLEKPQKGVLANQDEKDGLLEQ